MKVYDEEIRRNEAEGERILKEVLYCTMTSGMGLVCGNNKLNRPFSLVKCVNHQVMAQMTVMDTQTGGVFHAKGIAMGSY